MIGAVALRAAALAIAIAGVLLRAVGLGHDPFWNDEAWVAISTRVHGVQQFILSLSVTPILWAALLRPLDLLPLPPETRLRLLPLAFAIATLWLAWQLGERLAGHRLGGLLALALVALDPTSIVWSRSLKPYTAEAALALLTFLAADRVVRRGRPGDTWALALVLAAGSMLSNAQLLLAQPVLLALGIRAAVRRDRPALARLALAALCVGIWDVAWFGLLIRPWLGPVREYWDGHYVPVGSPALMARFVSASLRNLLGPGLGPDGLLLALGGLAVLLATPTGRWAALAVALLIAELVAASAARMFPLDVQRVALFVSTLLLVTSGAAAGTIVSRLWTRPQLRPAAAAALALFVLAVGLGRRWPPAPPSVAEDFGPLLRELERDRQPDDRILLYERSAFVWGYYQPGVPRLLPQAGGGAIVAIDDPAVTPVSARDADAAAARAFDGARRVWFIGSRLRLGDEPAIRGALLERGRIVRERRGSRADLVLVEPHDREE